MNIIRLTAMQGTISIKGGDLEERKFIFNKEDNLKANEEKLGQLSEAVVKAYKAINGSRRANEFKVPLNLKVSATLYGLDQNGVEVEEAVNQGAGFIDLLVSHNWLPPECSMENLVRQGLNYYQDQSVMAGERVERVGENLEEEPDDEVESNDIDDLFIDEEDLTADNVGVQFVQLKGIFKDGAKFKLNRDNIFKIKRGAEISEMDYEELAFGLPLIIDSIEKVEGIISLGKFDEETKEWEEVAQVMFDSVDGLKLALRQYTPKPKELNLVSTLNSLTGRAKALLNPLASASVLRGTIMVGNEEGTIVYQADNNKFLKFDVDNADKVKVLGYEEWLDEIRQAYKNQRNGECEVAVVPQFNKGNVEYIVIQTQDGTENFESLAEANAYIRRSNNNGREMLMDEVREYMDRIISYMEKLRGLTEKVDEIRDIFNPSDDFETED